MSFVTRKPSEKRLRPVTSQTAQLTRPEQSYPFVGLPVGPEQEPPPHTSVSQLLLASTTLSLLNQGMYQGLQGVPSASLALARICSPIFPPEEPPDRQHLKSVGPGHRFDTVLPEHCDVQRQLPPLPQDVLVQHFTSSGVSGQASEM